MSAEADPTVWAIVVAAGTGSRFGAPKQFALLAGRAVVEWSLEAARSTCGGVVLVVPGDRVEECSGWAGSVVAGGTTRSGSVRAGLALVPGSAQVIVVHDAARPLSSPGTWAAVVDEVRRGADGAVPCVPVTDTVKSVDATGQLVTLDRALLRAAQTPQAFSARALRAAHAGGAEATDDAALVEALGAKVVAVPGEQRNLKVTTPADLSLVEHLLSGAQGSGQ